MIIFLQEYPEYFIKKSERMQQVQETGGKMEGKKI